MKRFLKIIGWIVAVLIVLLVLAVVGLRLFFPMEKVKAMAIKRGSEALNRDISIQDLDLSFWGGLGVQLQGVTIGNPAGFEGAPLLTARNVDLKMKILPLLTGDFEIKRLIINEPEIHLLTLADSLTNFDFESVDTANLPPEARQIPSSSRPAAAAVSFDEFEIRGGDFEYNDRTSNLDLIVSGLDLSTSLTLDRPNVYASRGSLKLDSLRLAGKSPRKLGRVEINYDLTYDQEKKDAELSRLILEVGDITARGSGSLNHGASGLSAQSNLRIESVELDKLVALLAENQTKALQDLTVSGSLTVDADVEYSNKTGRDSLYYTGTATIDELKLAKSNIKGELSVKKCLVDFKPDNVRLTIEDGSFDKQPFKTHMLIENFNSPRVDGEVSGTFDLALILPLVATDFEYDLGGTTNADLKVSGPVEIPDSLVFSGRLGITNGFARSELLPEPLNEITLDAYFDNRLAKINKLAGKFPSGDISFSGRVSDLAPYLMADSVQRRRMKPEIEGNLKLKADLALAGKYLPQKGAPQLKGGLDLDLTVAGLLSDLSTMRPRVIMKVSNATYTDSLLPEPITKLNADFAIEPDTITVKNLAVKFTSSDVSMSGRMINPFPYLIPSEKVDRSKVDKPLFLFDLVSKRFDTDKMFPEAVPGSALDSTVSAIPDSVSVVILPDIDGRGTMSADTLVYSKVEFTNVKGKIRISDRKIECYDATASVYTGNVTGKTTIDLNDFEEPRYTGEFEATQIETNDFVSRFTKFGGHLYGKGDFKGSYSAVGWDPDAFRNSLTLDGHGTMREGKLVTSGVVYKALSELAGKLGSSFEKEQPLRGFATNLQVEDGKVRIDELKTILGTFGDVKLNGYYSLDGTLDYSATILLSAEITRKFSESSVGGLASLFGGSNDHSKQRLEIPMKITGTIDHPKIEPDYAALTKQAGENLKDKAGSLLEKLKKK